MTYLYLCEICGEFEADQKITDPPLEKCPVCEAKNVQSDKPKRLITSSSFILNGSGWAKDRYS